MPLLGLVVHEDRIPSVRGLVGTHNVGGKPFRLVDLERWVRLSRAAFNTGKVDVLACGRLAGIPDELFDTARELDVRLSLRTDATAPPEGLEKLAERGLLDVLLCPPTLETPHLDAWFDACRAVGLPVRLQLQGPFQPGQNADAVAARLAQTTAVAVNVTLCDPFTKDTSCRDAAHSRATLEFMTALGAALDARDIEGNLLGLPFCVVGEADWPQVVNTRQFHLDHQHYARGAYDLARRLFHMGPVRAAMVLEMLLVRHTCYDNPIDRKLLPWLLDWGCLRARTWAWHKLTRHLRFLGTAPKPREQTPEGYERAIARIKATRAKSLRPECSRCSLRRICDHDTDLVKRMLPGIEVSAVAGEDILDPLEFAAHQRKYYDPIDAVRRDAPQASLELAQRADERVNSGPPTREIRALDYEVQGTYCHRTEDSVRWYSFTNSEKTSTPLGRVEPPYTLSATFGGGIAEYVGFGFSRHGRVTCPMTASAHTLVLHVEPDGRYALLRDGRPVRPLEFDGDRWAPTRLGDAVEPRLVAGNIDGWIVSQNVLVWETEAPRATDVSHIRYSFVIVSVRYARRLEAVLQSIAHQDVATEQLEAVVAYVPGLDATDDVVDTIQSAYPNLRIVRSPFLEKHATAKGFMINESIRRASGEWVILLDADTIPPPGLCAALGGLDAACHFAVPDGRQMLAREATAGILLGEVRPWDDWDMLVDGPGDRRSFEADGVPIGYCQCVRRQCFEVVAYEEHGHFEGADWKFGRDLRDRFGPETRLEGLPALHLDHGGSNWYGTQRHH
ncbi:MAG TPA: glycosyltransferase [Candidatus Hydrogenedentes bacterium]|nr:glycosyltransferase [Candidatus Hydrogenedentota bacterium]